MKKLLLLAVITGLFFSCGSETKNKESSEEVNNQPPLIKTKNAPNLNISILLDLSDRIDTIKYSNLSMEFYNRDVGYLQSVAKAFSGITRTKKSRKLNDKIQLYFDPEPLNTEINELSNKLKFHVTRGNGTLKYIDDISDEYLLGGLSIYKQALKDNKYVGSDTWGFFKNKVQDYCIDKNYRNILVILTDGYIFYEDSNLNEDNLSTYITPTTIRRKGLNRSDWRAVMETQKHGFIPLDKDLSNLEILVLGINPSKNINNKYDYDVLKKYWSDWVYSMGVKPGNFAFKTAELPSNMDKIIKAFISN